jgi:hypothetical protein
VPGCGHLLRGRGGVLEAGPAPCLGRPSRHVRLLHWHSHESLNTLRADTLALPWRCGTTDLMTGIRSIGAVHASRSRTPPGMIVR